jgi:hypothetical protein
MSIIVFVKVASLSIAGRASGSPPGSIDYVALKAKSMTTIN